MSSIVHAFFFFLFFFEKFAQLGAGIEVGGGGGDTVEK